MKNKLTLIAALFPLLILTACNESEETKPTSQNSGSAEDKVIKAMSGTKLPKFMEAPKPNNASESTKP
ncbi:hypothetical protein [Polynucleobacter sp. AM-25C3]|jgi:uncharacterized lipoprotein YehR (DUF1307 family)|uniref:hypothetical protein n=1 Tax=Polynucleobacter sp. AM-25C3 TaxID=1855569 RepID=UPI001C0E53FB|nr:hypothetical protein [Polynucleobacter sp. AM-25C3]MBU3602315.1 hypothetical protein [Polynucleobacter sp. AM-25C3]